jgi:predicted XRE-type DNA-binding protein
MDVGLAGNLRSQLNGRQLQFDPVSSFGEIFQSAVNIMENLFGLRDIVREESLTHAEVARRGGSSRTRVTAILNGNLDNVSSDLLIRLLGALGYRVRISVSRMHPAA